MRAPCKTATLTISPAARCPGEIGDLAASHSHHRVAVGVPVGISGDGFGVDVERHAEPLQVVAELGDVVAVDQIVRVGVQEMDARAGEHERHGVLAGHDADTDAHGLEGAPGTARIGGDEDENGLLAHGRRALSSAR